MGYFLVQYVQRPDGNWQSPADCESFVKTGCFKQIRFDGSSGKGLVKCLQNETLPVASSTSIAVDDIITWLGTIARLAKTVDPDNTITSFYTLSEENDYVQRVGVGYY